MRGSVLPQALSSFQATGQPCDLAKSAPGSTLPVTVEAGPGTRPQAPRPIPASGRGTGPRRPRGTRRTSEAQEMPQGDGRRLGPVRPGPLQSEFSEAGVRAGARSPSAVPGRRVPPQPSRHKGPQPYGDPAAVSLALWDTRNASHTARDHRTVSLALKDPAPTPSLPLRDAQAGHPSRLRRASPGLYHSRHSPGPTDSPGGAYAVRVTAASRSPHLSHTAPIPHRTWYGPPYLLAPSLHPPDGAAVPAPAAPSSASGWGGSHSRCLILPLRPTSSTPPPGPDTVGLFREAGRSSLLNRWVSHVFGHFRPNRRKLPKWWRNLTALSEKWAERAEQAAERAEGMRGGEQKREGGDSHLGN